MADLKKFTFSSARFKSPGNIPTGHFRLDFIIHHGCDPIKVDLNSLEGYDPSVPLGFPLGKMVEIYGEEGGGKSSIAYRIVGNAQKLGHTCAWIDVEHSFSEDLAKINGCDVDKIIYPDNNLCAEDVIDLVIAMCNEETVVRKRDDGRLEKVNAPKVIIVDSIASMTPRARREADADQQYVGLLARLMSENLGSIAQAAEDKGVLIVWINQLREKIGTYGGGFTSPGGRAFKHFFSLRLKMNKDLSKESRLTRLDEDSGKEILIGAYSRVKIDKNRFAKPYLETIDIPIYYEEYFPDISDIAFDTGRQAKIISVRKDVFSWKDLKIEGRKMFVDYIKKNELIEDLIEDIKETAKNNNIILPPEITLYKSKKKNKKEIDEVNDGTDKDTEKVLRSRKKKDSPSREGDSTES